MTRAQSTLVEPGAREPCECLAERYDVLGAIGRGGMASAYRVHDRVTDQELALKRLSKPDAKTVGLFEREFHTLTQLAHPRIVRAYDYGIDRGSPFYTMELLDGGDLRELSPLPWQEVCALAYDVCSALSLLHSRRLVHRDLTPRNIRRTADGAAKLIDFGLLDGFGPVRVVAGTPPYVAPEVVNQVSLDGRSDLFSLGATLYHALTGQVAFPATRLEQLRDVWRSVPSSPRELVPGVPEALDRLVMSLLRVDSGSRPRSAAEVMDRIGPLLPSPPDDSLTVVGAYLSAPREVGRQAERVQVRTRILSARRGHGSGLLIAGESGTGRSRMLDSVILEAKLMGAVVARAGAADGASGPFGAARAIVAQVHGAVESLSHEVAAQHPEVQAVLFGGSRSPLPPLLDVGRTGLARAHVQAALPTWLSEIAKRRLLALAVDDFELIDEPSAALVAGLCIGASRYRQVCAVSVRDESLLAPTPALRVLREHTTTLGLFPLEAAQVRELLAGVFGDVPNLDALADRLHVLSGGRPRECMLLAQHLVDQRVITYAGGTFCLPSTIDASALPAGLEGALAAQVEALSPAARQVGALLSLAVTGRLRRAQLAAMEALCGESVDRAVEALQAIQVLAGTPDGYRMCHPSITRMLLAGASADELRDWHTQLAATYRAAGAGLVAQAYHALRGLHREEAIEGLLASSDTSEERTALIYAALDEIGVDRTGETYRLALDLAEAVGSRRARCRVWAVLAGIAAAGGDVQHYDLVAAPWLAETKRSSGFLDFHELPVDMDPAARAVQAFVKATERFEATPEAERGLSPSDAIKEMVVYVVFSIAVAARTQRPDLSASLAPLLEPFAPLNPVVQAMQLNAEASWALAQGKRELGRERYITLLDVIDGIGGEHLAVIDRVRAAVCQAIATNEAALGIHNHDPDHWLRTQDPLQQVGAEYIRKIVALHRGDWEAAEEHRRKAELLMLQNAAKTMFSTLAEELEVHALARDLTGLRNLRERIEEHAVRAPNWRSVAQLAEAYFHYLCGDGDRTRQVAARFRREVTQGRAQHRLLPLVEAAVVEFLLERGETEVALALARQALADCEARGFRHMGRIVAVSLALAEAAVGSYADARARIGAVIKMQQQLGVGGLLLGRSHEYLARCAIEAGDREGFEAAAQAAAEHYRPGQSEVLGALHERLMEDARRAGLVARRSETPATMEDGELTELITHVHTTFLGCRDATQRASAAITLLREQVGASDVHLFLLTEAGVTLSGSTGLDDEQGPQLLRHAEDQIDLEQDDDIRTMTATGTAMTADCAVSEVCDGEGGVLHAKSLLARRSGQLWLVGVVFMGGYRPTPRATTVCAAIAASLLESGDCCPISVA